MRNATRSLSTASSSSPQSVSTATDVLLQPAPTIRLINATPSATGTASGASIPMNNSFDAPYTSSSVEPRTHALSNASRKRLVPKKSKLGLLGSAKSKDRSQKDFSDVVRRVGGTRSAGRAGYEIYVDHPDDPGLKEIVLVKKKKSRLGLDGVVWGPLGESTNTASGNILKSKASENVLKPKGSTNILKPRTKENLLKPKGAENLSKPRNEEKDKWWSIGRSRKDSKEQKDSTRSKSPEPQSRARFNSLDSRILFSNPTASQPHPPYAFGTRLSPTPLVPSSPYELISPISSSDVCNSPSLFAPPMESQASGTGSIAIRAMKSMRSMARIGNWAQLGYDEKDKEKGGKKDKSGAKKKGKETTIRMSGSNFESGAVNDASPAKSPEEAPLKDNESAKSLGKKKQSVLGLGLPSSMRFRTARATSTSSSTSEPQRTATLKRSSFGSLVNLNILTGRRPSSTISNSSSTRPISTVSAISGKSSSSGASVKWDEEGLETVKKMRKTDRASRQKEKQDSLDSSPTLECKKENRKTSEGRQRPLVSDVFPETQDQVHLASPEPSSPPQSTFSPKSAIVNVEGATTDGHTETPVKRSRPRPVSEQLLGKHTKSRTVCDDIEGALSVLDAATNDLASLINRLDLEASPCASDGTPIARSQTSTLRLSASTRVGNYDSPSGSMRKRNNVECSLRKEVAVDASAALISSLRPCSQALHEPEPVESMGGNEHRIGQRIAPWNQLDWSVSPIKNAKPPVVTAQSTHKRTLSPPLPPFDPPPVFQPLRPPQVKASGRASDHSKGSSGSILSLQSSEPGTPKARVNPEPLVPSSSTFGDRPTKILSIGKQSTGEDSNSLHSPTPSPVFKKIEVTPSGIRLSFGSQRSLRTLIPPDTERRLSLAPNSDIPDELQVLLSSDGTEVDKASYGDPLSYRESEARRPEASFTGNDVKPIPSLMRHTGFQPVFHAQLLDEDANNADIEGSFSDDDTKKSFDFTGELKKLNESGVSHRRSFVEQLENAFKTPARVDLNGDFGVSLAAAVSNHQLVIPPVPRLPPGVGHGSGSTKATTKDFSLGELHVSSDSADSSSEGHCSCLGLPRISMGITEDEFASQLRSISSESSKPSNGLLNTSFKFGGGSFPEAPRDECPVDRPRTLSDVIPPPSRHSPQVHATNILPYASDVAVPRPRLRVNSDSRSKRYARGMSALSQFADTSHGAIREYPRGSFMGFDSFDEVRRGFEFASDRPAFYPPPSVDISRRHNKHDSVFSIASISSYGSVIDAGKVDPFGYANGTSRPTSEDFSMSVDDTFSFIHRGRRARVDSDASSFYFKAPPSLMVPNRRGYRGRESMISVASIAPPVSLYNRSHGGHRKSDSSGSTSSVYAVHSTSGGRAAWAKHTRGDLSLDSIKSDYSAMHLGRPALGDKMLESVFDHGMPLTVISASPTQSIDERFESRSPYDSIMDTRGSFTREDSLFEKTGTRNSSSDDWAFFENSQPARDNNCAPSHHFRPVSVISMTSNHSPRKEDDTMISMLGGGHIRRRSIGSMIAHSPCARVEKRGHGEFMGPSPIVEEISPARVIEKPSIASTTSSKFGGERMIKARKGVLERQSLEESCLIADGEELASFACEVGFVCPDPAARSRSSTCTDASSGTETPPLSSDASSMSGGSQSSLDIGHLDALLSNVTHPLTRLARRARARGQGHRRRVSETRASVSSVYETIQEENPTITSQVSVPDSSSQLFIPPYNPIYVVDDTTEATDAGWYDDYSIAAMRRWFALKDEAHDTVKESRRVWTDTPFSLFALQSFQPPAHPSGMQALLEHSKQNYGPLPLELRVRRVRSRTYSRPSPYPVRSVKRSLSPDDPRPVLGPALADVNRSVAPIQQPLREKPANINTSAHALDTISPLVIGFNKSKGGNDSSGRAAAHPRVTSSARRSALGWTKRSTGKSSDLKENTSIGMLTTPSDSLRINRPRPRGRPIPGSARAPAHPPAVPPMPQLRI